MATSRRAASEDGGSALVEAVVAMATVALATMVTAGAVGVAGSSLGIARARLAATTAALAAHEALRSRPLDDLVGIADRATDATDVAVLSGSPDVTVATRVRWGDPPGAGPGCAAVPGDTLLLETTARAADGTGARAPTVEVRLAATRAVPHRPGDAGAAVVVRIDDHAAPGEPAAPPLPVPGVAVLLVGPLDGQVGTHLTVTDAQGCAAFEALVPGTYRVVASAAGRVDAAHRSGPWPLGPDAAGSDPDAAPTAVVGTAPRSRPTVRFGLAVAATVSVEVITAQGAIVPSEAALRWWLVDDAPTVSVDVGAPRPVAPGARDVGLGPCRADGALPAGRLDVAPGAVAVVPLTMRAVQVTAASLVDRMDVRLEGEVACADGSRASLAWQVPGPWSGALLAVPPVPLRLMVVADGATLAVAPVGADAASAVLAGEPQAAGP